MGWKESYIYFSISAPCEAFPVTFRRSMKLGKTQDEKNELK